MIFKRTLEKNLETWRRNPDHKPLIIRGARQIGKTTLIQEFAKSYLHKIVLDLEKSPDADVFNDSMNVKSIVETLFLSANIPISAIGETLLFIDEIQESPAAIQMLRYFYEEYPRLNVIA
ncbi:MAG: AAA family ATPase, partial [Bacteroidales bacterium]|nr:AAA family ATPase [Bacteroidales bacterium]